MPLLCTHRAVLLALPLLLVLPSPVRSAKSTVAVAGTAWRTESKSVAVVRFRGLRDHVTDPATSEIAFGPGSGLAPDAFLWTMTDANSDQFRFPGTYELSKKGKPRLTLDPTAVEGEVQQVFDAILRRDFPGTLPPGVTITYVVNKTKAKLKAWNKGDGTQHAKSTLLLKFLAVARADGKRFPIRVSLKHAARGGPIDE